MHFPLWYGGPEGQNATTFLKKKKNILQNTTIFQETTGNGKLCVPQILCIVKCCVLTFWATVSERKTQHFTKHSNISESDRKQKVLFTDFFFFINVYVL